MHKDNIQICLAAILQFAIIPVIWSGVSATAATVITLTLVLANLLVLYRLISRMATERKKLEERALTGERLAIKSGKQAQLVMETSPVAIFLKDGEGNYQYVNRSFEELMGISRDDIIGRNESVVFPPEQAMSEQQTDKKVLSTGLPAKYEQRFWNSDGGSSNCLVTKHRIPLDEKGGYEIVGFIRDITHRKQTGQQLKKLFSALEQSPVSVVITNKSGKIEYVNSNFTRVSGYTLEEAIGMNPRILKSGHQPASFYRDLWQTILAGNVWKGEFLNRKKNGEEFWERAAISPVFNETGEITHFVAVKEDVTEMKQAERVLHQAKLNAEAANRAKNTFLVNMSHELRTPLNTILGYCQLLRNEIPRDERSGNYLETMWDSGKRLMKLINDILEMSRIESGRMELELKRFNLHHLLMDIVQMFTGPAEQKGINIIVEEDNAVSQTVVQDESKLRLILINLIRNAVYYTREGQVVVRLHCTPNNNEKLTGIPFRVDETSVLLKFEVQDTGLGIDQADHERIFCSFEQGGEGKRLNGGSGLGLTISRNYARMMGGDVVLIQSAPGKGSLFRAVVVAQAAGGNLLPENKDGMVEMQSAQDNLNILYLDQAGGIEESPVPVLENGDFRVEFTRSAAHAMEILEKRAFRFVILDLGSPVDAETESLDALAGLARKSGSVIIAVLDGDYDISGSAFFNDKVNGILRKPLAREELYRELARYLRVEQVSPAGSAATASAKSMETLRSEVTRLSPGFRREMVTAAQIGDLGDLDTLINQLDPQHALLQETLTSWLNRLDLEAIIELFKNGKDHDE